MMQQFALVFTCSAEQPILEADIMRRVAAVESYPADGEVIWLASGISCETRFAARPEQAQNLLEAARACLIDCPVDVNLVLNDGHRRKSLFLADMDSTIIEQECIDELADVAGVGAEVKAVTEQAMRGELDFAGALRARVKRLAGLDAAVISQVISERISVSPGAKTLVATMARSGAYCVLVSGGFTRFTGAIAEAVGFHENRANILDVEGGLLTGRVIEPILGREAKEATLLELLKARGLPPDAALAVGDGANDLAMLNAAGLGVAYRAKPLVAASADAVVKHADLTALLYLQGYTEQEFHAQDG